MNTQAFKETIRTVIYVSLFCWWGYSVSQCLYEPELIEDRTLENLPRVFPAFLSLVLLALGTIIGIIFGISWIFTDENSD